LKKIIIPIIILAFINYGCYSFYEVSSEDIPNQKEHDDIKLELKNNVDILLKKEGNFNIEVTDTMIYFSNKTVKDSIKISDIEKIYNKKISFGKIIGVGLIVVAGFFFILMLSSLGSVG
jgi:hypothetical protein